MAHVQIRRHIKSYTKEVISNMTIKLQNLKFRSKSIYLKRFYYNNIECYRDTRICEKVKISERRRENSHSEFFY